MKSLSFLSFFFLTSFLVVSQTFYTGFEDGTLEGWTNADATTQNITVVSENSNFLSKTSDGSTNPQARMSIINTDTNFWAGNYFYSPIGEQALRTVDDIVLRNQNNFDLHIRYAFTGANGYTVVTTEPLVVPANSDWDFYTLGYGADFNLNSLLNLTIMNDTSTLPWTEVMQQVHELFENVVAFKVFHNPDLSDEGVSIAGTLDMESILSYELLVVESNLEKDLQIYPNPTQDIVQIKSPNFITNLQLYNTQGALVLDYKLNSMEGNFNISNVAVGIYVLEVTFESGESISRKLVKE